MSNSRKKPFLTDELNGDRIPPGTLACFRERFRVRLHDLVREEFLKQHAESGLTRAEVARRIGPRPEQITRWFGAPYNRTLETISDLLLAVARSEPDVTLLPLEGRVVRNDRNQSLPTPRPIKPAASRQPRSGIEANEPPAGHSASVMTREFDQHQHQGFLASIPDSGGRHEIAHD